MSENPSFVAEQLRHYLEWLESSGQVQYLPTPVRVSPPKGANPKATPPPSARTSRVGSAAKPSVASAKSSPTAGADSAPSGSSTPLRAQAKDWSAEQKLNYLRHKVLGDCQRCPLAEHRQHLVFGEGNPNAKVMVVGEAPGAQEDRAGRPFVGAAGQRLDRWIATTGWTRGELYIANVLKCRPPQNRDPAPREIEACRGFLMAQIRAISPDVIVALGRFAGALVLGRPGLRLYQMRGNPHFYRDPKLPDREISVVVTYHPSFVLRKEKELRSGQSASQEESQVLEDFARARAAVNASAPDNA